MEIKVHIELIQKRGSWIASSVEFVSLKVLETRGCVACVAVRCERGSNMLLALSQLADMTSSRLTDNFVVH